MFVFAHVLGTLLAVAPSPSPSPAPLPEITHVYTSDRGEHTLNNTARTTYVVTREQIAQNGYRTVADALVNIPGVEIMPYGPIGSSVYYGIRGSNSAQVLVLINGLPAPGSFANSVEIGNLPTTGVDRIEVVEGGGSTLYGTGAIGGIINIITQRSASTGAMVRYGSFADREFELTTDHVQFTRIVANNNYGLPGDAARPDVDYQSSALHANGERKIGAFDAALRGGIESDHLGAPGPDGVFLSPTSRENDLNEFANLTLTKKSAQADATIQTGGSNQHIFFACSSSDPNCSFPAGTLNTEGRFDFGARNAVRGANEELLYGIDLSRGAVRSDSGGSATPPISTNPLAQTAAYVQNRIDTRWGNFYAGLRGERDGGLGGELSPSAGFVVRLSNDASLKGNLATAFRAPNASELYFPGYGNPSLKSERAKVADFTIEDSHFLGGASIGWFGNRTRDLILPEPVAAPGPSCTIDSASFTFEPCNVDHAFIEGLTMDVRTVPYHGFTTSFNVTDLYRAEDLDAQLRLPHDPVISANLRLDYTGSPSGVLDSFGAVINMAGASSAFDSSLPPFDRAAAYTSVNAYLRIRPDRNMYLTLRGYNLGNERYAAVSGYPLPGRSFALEVSTK